MSLRKYKLLFKLVLFLLITTVSFFVVPEKTEIKTNIIQLNDKEIIEENFVNKVIDGDTIQLKSGERVRYIGIDTPEISHTKNTKNDCFGLAATEANSDLVLNKKVRLVRDVSKTDKYSRLLRYVYVLDINNKEMFVNQLLLERGYATVFTVPPDVKYAELFKQSEAKARTEKLGLWSSCVLK